MTHIKCFYKISQWLRRCSNYPNTTSWWRALLALVTLQSWVSSWWRALVTLQCWVSSCGVLYVPSWRYSAEYHHGGVPSWRYSALLTINGSVSIMVSTITKSVSGQLRLEIPHIINQMLSHVYVLCIENCGRTFSVIDLCEWSLWASFGGFNGVKVNSLYIYFSIFCLLFIKSSSLKRK